MSKILKASRFKGQHALKITPKILEDFPERIVQPEHQDAIEEEFIEVVDPEAVRAEAVAAAQNDIEAAMHKAIEEGRALGQQEGREAFDASIAQCAQSLSHAAEALQAARQSYLDSLSPQLVELATLIAERVLVRELKTDPELILHTVNNAVSRILDREQITIKVHPTDLEALRHHRVTLLDEFSGVEELTIIADDSLAPGDCLAESRQALVDARQDVLLQHVLDQLLD